MDLTRNRMTRAVGKARDVIVANAARGLDQVKTPLYRNAFYLMLAYVVGLRPTTRASRSRWLAL